MRVRQRSTRHCDVSVLKNIFYQNERLINFHRNEVKKDQSSMHCTDVAQGQEYQQKTDRLKQAVFLHIE